MQSSVSSIVTIEIIYLASKFMHSDKQEEGLVVRNDSYVNQKWKQLSTKLETHNFTLLIDHLFEKIK
jgi:hypothetical protein